MRVIAGKLKGRQFDSPSGHRTHPMSDKVRDALFNALGDLDDLTVLDAFAGTGALGFEAISRGATQVTALDVDRNATDTIIRNAKSLQLGRQLKATRANASSWLETQPDAMFDIVLLDPPYDDLQPSTLQKAAERTKPGGIVVLSMPPQATVALTSDFEVVSTKAYGDATLTFYRRAIS